VHCVQELAFDIYFCAILEYAAILYTVLLQIAKEAKDCVQECVSEFVSFITSEYPFARCMKYDKLKFIVLYLG